MAKGTYENGQRDATIQSVADDVAEIKELIKDLPCLNHAKTLVRHNTILKVLLAIGLAVAVGQAIHYLT